MSEKKASIRHAFKTIILPRKNLLLLGLLLIVVSRVAGLALPTSSKYLIDDVVANGDLELLKLLITLVVIAIIVQSASNFALTRILSVEAQHLIAQLRVKIQKHIIKLPIDFFDQHKSGELLSRIMSDVEGVRNLVGTGLVQLFGGIITAIVSLVYLLMISPMLTLFVLIPVSIFGIISSRSFGKIRPHFRERGKIKAQVTGRLAESLNGIRVIKGFSAEEHEILTFERGALSLYQNVKKTLTTTALVTSSSTLVMGLATAGIMGIGGYMIVNEELTVGEFLSFTLYLGFMVGPIMQMSNIGSQVTEALAGLDRMEEILSLKLEVDNQNRTKQLSTIEGNISFKHVNFAYEEDKNVLHDITFDANRGSVTALVGTSGSGKSTIASLVSSFVSPQSGKLTVDGIDLSTVTLDSYRQHLGVVLQDDFLFDGSIKENILFPRPSATESELHNAVKAAHVHEFSDRFEDGLDTIIGERGVKLSGGQRQRIAIARAILADPSILILDEATSNLDTESEAFIQESLKALMKGRTTFVIAHRLSTIKQADQILVIEGGRIAEHGNHDHLINLKGRYHDLYTYQAKI